MSTLLRVLTGSFFQHHQSARLSDMKKFILAVLCATLVGSLSAHARCRRRLTSRWAIWRPISNCLPLSKARNSNFPIFEGRRRWCWHSSPPPSPVVEQKEFTGYQAGIAQFDPAEVQIFRDQRRITSPPSVSLQREAFSVLSPSQRFRDTQDRRSVRCA